MGGNQLKVLVTGSNGLLGKIVCNNLVTVGHDVFAVVRPGSEVDNRDAEIIEVDLANSGFSSRFPENIDAIVHLAQSAAYRDFPFSASEVFRVNLGSTQELLDYASRSSVKRFTYASSGGVYESGAFSILEDSEIQKPNDIDFYLASKLGSELLIQSYRGIFSHSILRFFFIYGPGQRRDMFLPRLFDKVAAQDPIIFQGKSGLVANPIHVVDASRAVVSSLELFDSRTINVAGPDQVSLVKVARIFGEYLGIEPILVSSGGKEVRLVADISRMTQLLVEPRIRLSQSVSDIAPRTNSQFLPG